MSFLRGFSVAKRNVLMGASEDEVFEAVREGTGRFSFASLWAPSGSVCMSFAAGRTDSFERLDDTERAGRGGFTNVGGSGLCGFVILGAPCGGSGGTEVFVTLGSSGLRGFAVVGALRGFSKGTEGFVNTTGSDLCGIVVVDDRFCAFSCGLEDLMVVEGAGLCGFVALGVSRLVSGKGGGMGTGF